MIGLIQRVSEASVTVDKRVVGAIDAGILLLLGVEKNDSEENAQKLLDKVINFRIFEDQNHKMNLSLLDSGGAMLIVPQFTLPASTKKGNRPSFTSAAPPEQGKRLYDIFVNLARDKVGRVATGEFAADMQVSLVNSGPVTFWLEK